jgi:hypothetical protein
MIQDVDVFADFSKTLDPNEYQRYLEVRRQRAAGVPRYKSDEWIGVDPLPTCGMTNRHKILENIRKADAELDRRLHKRIQEGTKVIVKEINVVQESASYTAMQIAERLGVQPQAIGAWQRRCHIPADAMIARATYKKSVIDEMIANGSLPPQKAPRTRKAKAVPPKHQAARRAKTERQAKVQQKLPMSRESDAVTRVSGFWQKHTELASKILSWSIIPKRVPYPDSLADYLQFPHEESK